MLIYYHNYSASARISERLRTDKTKELSRYSMGRNVLINVCHRNIKIMPD